MHAVLSSLIALLTQYTYPALFVLLVLGIVGLPVPDETLLTFCGYLVFSGRLRFDLTFLTGFLGSVSGITISYILGARFGRSVLERFGRSRILKVEQTFQRFGPLLLTVGYFIPGVRHFTAVVAGMSRLRPVKFALFAYPGAAIWVGTFLTLGFVFGNGWQQTSETVHHYILLATALGAAFATAFWLLRRLR